MKICVNLYTFEFGNDFLDMTPNIQAIQEKINGTYSTLKTLGFKGHYQESEETTHRWEKISANHISGEGSISKIYKELLKLNNKKTTQLKDG